MIIKQVQERPEEGQYVAIWSYGGKIWSNAFREENGRRMMYYEEEDDFFPANFNPESVSPEVIYFILEEGGN